MPIETRAAVDWALQQVVTYPDVGLTVPVTKDTPTELVDKVREYFNTNEVPYSTFSFPDLLPYLEPQEPEQPEEPAL